MNEKQKQIEEMVKAICEHYVKNGCGRCPDCFCEGDALKLYNAGYRKQSENNIELPCKVGDTLYHVIDPEDISWGRVLEVKVKSIEIEDTIRFFVRTVKNYLHNYAYVNIADFGKTVFFTQKEAEQVLAKTKGD